jgi:hypothetical protein
MDSITRRFVTFFTVAATVLPALACGGGTSPGGDGNTISRAQFIETYVELRKAGLQSRNSRITVDKQKEILDSLGTTEEQLLAFVEHWGNNGDVMLGIWEEVDSIMLEARVASGLEEEDDAEEQARRLREEEDRGRPDPGGEGGGNPPRPGADGGTEGVRGP